MLSTEECIPIEETQMWQSSSRRSNGLLPETKSSALVFDGEVGHHATLTI
jgi:hypothetical protein